MRSADAQGKAQSNIHKGGLMADYDWQHAGNWTNANWQPQNGQNQFEANQAYIQNLNTFSDPNQPSDPNDTSEDRYDPRTGLIYSFDEDANGGQGAWAVVGKNTKGGGTDFNDDDVAWIADGDEASYNAVNWDNNFYEV
jgi:hypothetical protein